MRRKLVFFGRLLSAQQIEEANEKMGEKTNLNSLFFSVPALCPLFVSTFLFRVKKQKKRKKATPRPKQGARRYVLKRNEEGKCLKLKSSSKRQPRNQKPRTSKQKKK
jgi:hypothetical protein